MVDHEHSGSISTRKLVIEAAKFNVLTAYSATEAIETLKRFPAIDGIVTDAGPVYQHCRGADYQLESFDPRVLLELIEKLCPNQISAIEKHDEKLKGEGK